MRARLAASRAQILHILEPPRHSEAGGQPGTPPGGLGGGFPRSRTMKLLLSGRGVGTVGAVIGGLLMARPALAWRLLRMIPTSAVRACCCSKPLRSSARNAAPTFANASPR